MHTPHKKKIFVKSQIPQFIREEYPLFLELMEQYYDFLDEETGKIVAVKVIEGGSGYNPIVAWQGNTTYEGGSRFSFNNRVYQVIGKSTSSSITKTFNINTANASSEYLNVTSHGLSTGDEVIYSFNGATGPAGATGVIGLVDNNTYWVRPVNSNTLQIFNTRAGAVSGATGALVNLSNTGISQTHKFTAGPYHGATGTTNAPTSFAGVTTKFISTGGINPVIVYFQTKDSNGVYINDPKTGSAAAASGYPVIESGVVKKIVVTNSGSDYTEDEAPIAIVTGGGGSGCVAEAVATLKFGNINAGVAAAKSSRDIDESIELFVDSLRKEFSPKIPERLYTEVDSSISSREVDTKKFIKFIKQFYNSKGAEKSIKFLFRILFDSDVELYFPKVDMLRVSDGKWSQDSVIRITPSDESISEEDFTDLYLGEKIIGVTSGTTAVIQSIHDVAIAVPGTVFELNLTDINGTFDISGEDIKIYNLDKTKSDDPIGAVNPCIVSLDIVDGGINYSIGDQILAIPSFIARVTNTDTITSEPRYFVISNIASLLYRSFNIASDVNGTSKTITFRNNHNFATGDSLTYTFGQSADNKTTIANFNIKDNVDYVNNRIIFNEDHTYNIGDRVIYSFNGATGPEGATGPIGLIDDVSYYVGKNISDDSGIVAKVDIPLNIGSLTIGATGISNYMSPGLYGLIFTGGGGSGATGLATLQYGSTGVSVSSVSLIQAGTGYTSAPTVTIAGASGFTTNYSIIANYSGGSNYTVAPTLTFTNPYTGATTFNSGAANIGSTGFVPKTQIQVNFAIPGATGVSSKFYRAANFIADSSSVPTHNFGVTNNWRAIGRNALGTCTISSGSVNTIKVTDSGFGYSIPPIVSFSGEVGATTAVSRTALMYSDIPNQYVNLYSSYDLAINGGSTGIVPLGATGLNQNHTLYLAPIGLKDNTTYYARITGATGVQLYKNYAGAIAGSTGSLVAIGSTGVSEYHSLYDPELIANINPTSKTITFVSPHNFKTGRKIIYSFNGATGPVGSSGPIGLTDGETYYARITGSTGFQLFTSYAGALAGSTGSLVSLGSTGLYQIHKFTQVSDNSITDYKIENFGFNFPQGFTSFTTNGGTDASFIGNVSSLLTYDGSYIGTDSQPSSQKKIQDSEYYQDFSYEIISDQSANIFGKLIEQTIHPAGLRYFSKILSVKDESLYEGRYNYNPFYYQYTYFVEGSPRADFDITDLLDNGTEWQAGDSVSVGTTENPTKIFVRISGNDYVYIVSESGTFGATPPAAISGEQTNGTAKLIFSGVAEKLLSVYVNGELKTMGSLIDGGDYFMADANTVEFYSPLPVGSIVRIYKREETPFDTDYNEYAKTYTTIVIRRNNYVKDSIRAYKWFAGLPSTPTTWARITPFVVNDLIEWLGNYYIVTTAGTTGERPPVHEIGSATNGTCILKYFNPFKGYIGDILYHNTNFYKITGTTNANISAIFGQNPPTHTSGTATNGKVILEYYEPGFRFWVGSTGYEPNEIIYHNSNWYKVINSSTATSGVSGPVHNFGTQTNGTLNLQHHTIDHDFVTTIPVVSQLDPGKAMLGPTVNDIVRNVNSGIPDYFQDFIGTIATPGNGVTSTIDASVGAANVGLSSEDDEYTNYSMIITVNGGSLDNTKYVRRITNYNGTTKVFTLSHTIDKGTSPTSLSYRLIQNYILSSVSGATGGTGIFGLSPYDPAYELNAIVKKEFSFDPTNQISSNTISLFSGATGLGYPGATGYYHGLSTGDKVVYYNNGNADVSGLTSGTKYWVTVTSPTSVKLATNYDNSGAGATGALTPSNISITAGSTGIHKLYLENNSYPYYNIIITSGGGVNSVLNILEYNEIDNTISCEGNPGTIIADGATGVANESTYYIYPDLYRIPTGATGPNGTIYNDDHFSGSVVSIVISSGGQGYQISDTISIVGGYGSGAVASIGSVDGNGKITSINVTSSGSGYIYEPRVTVNSATGTGVSLYPIMKTINGVGVGLNYNYSTYGHYVFVLSGTTKTTTGSAVAGSEFITIDSGFDTSNIRTGMIVSGTGIATGTIVTDIAVVDTGLSITKKIKLSKYTTGSVSGTITFTSKRPYPDFEYGETINQVSIINPSITNKSRVIKCDYINNVLYVEKDEESDELNSTNNLTRVRDSSTLQITGATGIYVTGEMYSGWKSTNVPVESIIKVYPI